MKKIYTVIFLILAILIGGGLFYFEGTLPVNRSQKTYQSFVVPRGANVSKIINSLAAEGLIRNKLVFFILVKQLKIENQIQAGEFQLSKSMTPKEIAIRLTKASNDVWVTIIEGIRKEEVAHVLSKDIDFPEAEFIRLAQEGTLFPDTYLVPRNASVSQILSIFKRNFDTRYSAELREKARARGFTDTQVLTLASLVEREANSMDAKRNVASILVKRWKSGWPLQVDATVQYALGYQENTNTWWKQTLTKQDLAIDSIFNTYKRQGLPPAPIASPGLDAIIAVIEANEKTPYWYYISNKDGSKMIYSVTLEEHEKNINLHLR